MMTAITRGIYLILSFLFQLEPAKYERGIVLLRELLYQTEFTTERLRIIAAKIANDVAQLKRNGNSVAKDLMKGLCYSKGNYKLEYCINQFNSINISVSATITADVIFIKNKKFLG